MELLAVFAGMSGIVIAYLAYLKFSYFPNRFYSHKYRRWIKK